MHPLAHAPIGHPERGSYGSGAAREIESAFNCYIGHAAKITNNLLERQQRPRGVPFVTDRRHHRQPMVARQKTAYFAFGERLTAALQRAAISQRTAAKQLGVSEEAVRLYCKGKRMPDDDKLTVLSRLVGIDVATLRYGDQAGRSSLPSPISLIDDDERSLIESYRALPEWGKKSVRARVAELLENFAPPSLVNPYGKGRQ